MEWEHTDPLDSNMALPPPGIHESLSRGSNNSDKPRQQQQHQHQQQHKRPRTKANALCAGLVLAGLYQLAFLSPLGRQFSFSTASDFVPATAPAALAPTGASEVGANNIGEARTGDLRTSELRTSKVRGPRSLPWLVLHVGPPKTATTTIQDGLASWPVLETLAVEDNIYYLGQKRGPIQTVSVDGGGDDRPAADGHSRSNETVVTLFPMTELFSFRFPNKYSYLLKILKEHSRLGRNVVISSEHFTSHFRMESNGERLMDGIFLRGEGGTTSTSTATATAATSTNDPLFHPSGVSTGGGTRRIYPPRKKGPDVVPRKNAKKGKARRSSRKVERRLHEHTNATHQSGDGDGDGDEERDGFGFRVKVVVTYRHFFQWLPSLHYQRYQASMGKLFADPDADPSKAARAVPGMADYIESFLSEGAGETEKDLDTIRRYQRLSGSLYAYQMWSSRPELYDKIDVFDFHQQPYYPGGDERANATALQSPPPRGGPRHVLRDFCCQVLPTAASTCSYLVDDAASGDPLHASVKRKSHRVQGALLTEQDRARIVRLARWKVPDLLSEARPGWEKASFRPEDVLFRRIEEWSSLPANDTEGGHERALPTVCPSENTLRELRDRSVYFLEEMVRLVREHSLSRRKRRKRTGAGGGAQSLHDDGDLFRSSYHPDSPASRDHLLLSRRYREEDGAPGLPPEVVKAHDASFEEYASSGKFCHVDVDKLFGDEGFVRYVFAPL